jgi:hypothetical protein
LDCTKGDVDVTGRPQPMFHHYVGAAPAARGTNGLTRSAAKAQQVTDADLANAASDQQLALITTTIASVLLGSLVSYLIFVGVEASRGVRVGPLFARKKPKAT